MSRSMMAAVVVAMSAFVVVAVAQEAERKPAEQAAEIHFADLNGIRDWKAEGNDALIVEGRNGAKFRATFIGTCTGLNFAQSIGFVTGPGGDLDKFDAVLVDGKRCQFRTFERLAAAAAAP